MLWNLTNIGVLGSISSFVPPVIIPSTLTNSLCAFYNFNDTILDSSGNNFNFTAVGSPAYSTGINGNSFNRNSSTYIVNNNSFNFSGAFTVSFWVNLSAIANNAQGFIHGAGLNNIGIYYSPVVVFPGQGESTSPPFGNLYISNVGSSHDTWSNIPYIVPNTWRHIVMTRSATATRVDAYVDGVFYPRTWSEMSEIVNNYSTSSLTIGNGTGFAATQALSGRIDNLGIWGRALTPNEISTLYNNGNGLQFPFIIPINALVVAGGGGGGVYAGGGAGGVVFSSSLSATFGSTYNITVGNGGLSTFNGTSALYINGNGGNSSIIGLNISLSAAGGGAGATAFPDNGGGLFSSGGWVIYGGANGGSGGGSGGNSNGSGAISRVGGSGITGQGNKGGDGASVGCTPSGGGGGAGAAGANNFNSSQHQQGGIGIINPIAGSTVGQLSAGNYWIGGGGSGATNACSSSVAPLSGGLGGGGRTQGAGSFQSISATSGLANTGGGGGGGWSTDSGSGGSGVVVLSYQSPTQRATGGTVTSFTSGGNVFWIHTFTSNGTFTI